MRAARAAAIGFALVTLLASAARAQTPAPPAAAATPATPGANAPPPPWLAPAGPPPYYGYPYGAPIYEPYPQPFSARAQYEQLKRSEGICLLIELLLPGGGSLYADHVAGSLVTWAGTITGFVFLLHGLNENIDATEDGFFGNSETAPGHPGDRSIEVGLVVLLAARVFGLADTWYAAKRYNHALAARLGLRDLDVDLTLAPVVSDHAVAWGPALSLRF
jgi:hypothetical protein